MQKNKKMKLLRDFANSLGICRVCFHGDVEKNKNVCTACRERNKRASRKKRNDPIRCSRCGRLRDDQKYKTCSNCRKINV